jgi:hypothetical protein
MVCVLKNPVPSDIPDLVQALHLLLCSLSLAVVNGLPPRDAGIGELCHNCGADPDRVEQMRRSLFDPMVDRLVRTNVLHQDADVVNDDSRPETVPQRSMGYLTSAIARTNIAALHAAYLEGCPPFSFDDSQLLRGMQVLVNLGGGCCFSKFTQKPEQRLVMLLLHENSHRHLYIMVKQHWPQWTHNRLLQWDHCSNQSMF